jgi:hypothetical protein
MPGLNKQLRVLAVGDRSPASLKDLLNLVRAKKMSVVLLGMRSKVAPRARSGLNVFATWLAVISIPTVCAGAHIASATKATR